MSWAKNTIPMELVGGGSSSLSCGHNWFWFNMCIAWLPWCSHFHERCFFSPFYCAWGVSFVVFVHPWPRTSYGTWQQFQILRQRPFILIHKTHAGPQLHSLCLKMSSWFCGKAVWWDFLCFLWFHYSFFLSFLFNLSFLSIVIDFFILI